MTLTQQLLAATIGPELARRLLQRWPGARLPKRPDLGQRDAAVLRDLDAGMLYREAAERNGLSISQIFRISKGRRH
jgi:hypothetical protein